MTGYAQTIREAQMNILQSLAMDTPPTSNFNKLFNQYLGDTPHGT